VEPGKNVVPFVVPVSQPKTSQSLTFIGILKKTPNPLLPLRREKKSNQDQRESEVDPNIFSGQ
jgi:hypothetical protein